MIDDHSKGRARKTDDVVLPLASPSVGQRNRSQPPFSPSEGRIAGNQEQERLCTGNSSRG